MSLYPFSNFAKIKCRMVRVGHVGTVLSAIVYIYNIIGHIKSPTYKNENSSSYARIEKNCQLLTKIGRRSALMVTRFILLNRVFQK